MDLDLGLGFTIEKKFGVFYGEGIRRKFRMHMPGLCWMWLKEKEGEKRVIFTVNGGRRIPSIFVAYKSSSDLEQIDGGCIDFIVG